MYAPRQRPGLWTANHTCKNHIRSSSSSVLAKANITSSYPIEDTSYTRLSNMNVDAYLRAIGLDRSSLGAPSRDSLHAIYRAHVQTIPFNSIPVYAGEGVDPRLDAAGLLDKLVTRGVGGVCFEHATLLWTVLQELGFNAHLMGGEVSPCRYEWSPMCTPSPSTNPNGLADGVATGRSRQEMWAAWMPGADPEPPAFTGTLKQYPTAAIPHCRCTTTARGLPPTTTPPCGWPSRTAPSSFAM